MKLNTFKSYLIITLGIVINSLGWTAFLIPSEIVGGGLSGVGSIIYFVTKFPVGFTVLLINLVLILMAIKILGAQFGIKTIYGIIIQSLSLTIFQMLIEKPLVPEAFMSTVVGGIMLGAGIGIVFSQGGSTGGTDIIAMIINKYKNIGPGKILLSLDVIIIASSYLIFGSIEKIVYGLTAMAVCAYTIDLIIEGNKQSAQVFIISQYSEKIAEKILSDLDRGVTALQGRGYYTKQDMEVLMILVRKNEVPLLFRIVKEIDPKAFISLGNVMGVYGKGFLNIRY